MDTPGPALRPTVTASQGGPSILFERLKGLTESLFYTKSLLAGQFPKAVPAPRKSTEADSVSPTTWDKTCDSLDVKFLRD